MKHKALYGIILCSLPGFMSCSGKGDEPTPQPVPTPPAEEKMQISISPSIKEARATDYGFEPGDATGLFVVNYSGNTPGVLAASGNYVDNMRFKYNGAWTADNPIFWADDKTHSDFYLYYPYTATVGSVEAYPFTVKADQSTETAYKASDLMVGRALNVAPSSSATVIPVNHMMSRIVVTLEAGNGFTQESIADAEVAVRINGIKCNSTVNLATGDVAVAGEATSVIPFFTDNSYKALIVPQTLEEGNLITVTVDGREYNLKKEFEFESSKSHKFTVTLSKTSNGVNVNINPWYDDGIDTGGVAE